MKHRAPILVLLSFGAFALASPPVRSEVPKAAAAKPSFSGSWSLDSEGSDDAGAKMKDAMGERHGRGGFMGVPAGRGSGGGGPMSGGAGSRGGVPSAPGAGGFEAPPSREQMETMRQAMDDALHATQDLVVTEDGLSFEIVHDGDRVVRLYADGRKNKGSTGIDKKTKWEADKLVTESKVSASFGATVRITETWAMVDPARLAITTRLEGGPFEKAVVIRRLYARSVLP
jgi:hypothetical protein